MHDFTLPSFFSSHTFDPANDSIFRIYARSKTRACAHSCASSNIYAIFIAIPCEGTSSLLLPKLTLTLFPVPARLIYGEISRSRVYDITTKILWIFDREGRWSGARGEHEARFLGYDKKFNREWLASRPECKFHAATWRRVQKRMHCVIPMRVPQWERLRASFEFPSLMLEGKKEKCTFLVLKGIQPPVIRP